MTGPAVVLVGPMGSGKTTVGRLVAQRAGCSFADTDALVEEEEGRSVSDIFVDEGEAYFRDVERRTVLAALGARDGVLSLGGGAVLDPDVRAALREVPVVFLDVGLADAARRVGLGQGRPLLLGNVRGRVKQLMDERRPIYLEVADHVVLTDGRTPEEVAAEVWQRLEESDD